MANRGEPPPHLYIEVWIRHCISTHYQKQNGLKLYPLQWHMPTSLYLWSITEQLRCESNWTFFTINIQNWQVVFRAVNKDRLAGQNRRLLSSPSTITATKNKHHQIKLQRICFPVLNDVLNSYSNRFRPVKCLNRREIWTTLFPVLRAFWRNNMASSVGNTSWKPLEMPFLRLQFFKCA